MTKEEFRSRVYKVVDARTTSEGHSEVETLCAAAGIETRVRVK